MEKENTIERARSLAEKSPVTGAFPALYAQAFKFPPNFEDKSVADLYSGISAFSEAVYLAGGNPIAIDFNYHNFQRLFSNFDLTFQSVMKNDTTHTEKEFQETFLQHVQLFKTSVK